MNIITYKLEKNTISDGNMEGDLLFILHKLTIGKKITNLEKKKKCQKSMEDAVFLCNLTGGINIRMDCLCQTALFYGKDICLLRVFGCCKIVI